MPQFLAFWSVSNLVFQRKNHSELPWDERSLISCIMLQRRRNSQKAPNCPCLWISCHSSCEEERMTLSLLSLLCFIRNAPSLLLCVLQAFPWYCSWSSPSLSMTEDMSTLNLTSTFLLTTTEQAGWRRCLNCPKQTEPTPIPSSRRCCKQTNKVMGGSFWQQGRF